LQTPLDDVAAEARRLLSSAREQTIPLHLLGGVAIELRRPPTKPRLLERTYKDIDFLGRKGSRPQLMRFLDREGYVPDEAFNTANGRRRLLFWDLSHGRQVDVFIEEFEMCHVIPIADRVAPGASTIPLAELLATKLQIVEINSKDEVDILNLLHDHPVIGDDVQDGLSASRLAQLCAADWGLWRTCTRNLERIRAVSGAYGLRESDRQRVVDRLTALSVAIESAPKSLKWRLRDRVGERIRWYELPDEVG
jgi:hypothetical protein